MRTASQFRVEKCSDLFNPKRRPARVCGGRVPALPVQRKGFLLKSMGSGAVSAEKIQHAPDWTRKVTIWELFFFRDNCEMDGLNHARRRTEIKLLWWKAAR